VSNVLVAEATPQGAASTEPHGAAGAGTSIVRVVLAGYVRTLVVPLLCLVALLTCWTLASATGWPAALAAVAGWSGAVAFWLYRRGWSAALAQLVSWAAPAVLMAPSGVLGWLSAEGLVLWFPVTTLLTVCLALTHQPLRVCLAPGSLEALN
jgi:hypothetical protein